MMDFMISYAKAVSLGPDIVGGKGWNMGRLQRYGFSVPQGGILIADVYTQFMQKPDILTLRAQLTDMQPTDAQVADTLKCIRDEIAATPLPTQIEDSIRAFLIDTGLVDQAVAVRSSATAEDSITTSFAGIHQSFLDVRGYDAIVESIKGCYASLWTPQAFTYRHYHGLSDEAVACAVVICALVCGPELAPPIAAGVAFSCDPRTGQRDRVTINSVAAWGDAITSGKLSPEEITLHDETGYIERSGSKVQTLTGEQVIVLAALVRRISWTLNDGPQDIEWAYDGQQFWLLQARPVTSGARMTLPAIAALPTIWSNANLKENMADVATPLGRGVVQPIIEIIMLAPCKAAKYALPAGLEVSEYFNGRAYMDLTTILWSYYDALGLLPREVNQGMGGHQPEIPVPSQQPLRGRAGLRRTLARIRLLKAISRTTRTLPRAIEQTLTQARAYRRSFTETTTRDLFLLFQQIHEDVKAFAYRFQLINMNGVWGDYLIQALESKRPGEGRSLASALTTGSGKVVSAEHGYRLYEVADAARADPDALAYLEDHADNPNGWRTLPAHSPFRQAFTVFLDEFGHRGACEYEIATPRWRDDPAYLLTCIQTLLTQEIPVPPYQLARKRRLAAKAEVAHFPLHTRLLVSWLTRQARRTAVDREAAKSALIALFTPLRTIALELGQRMVEDHLLCEQEDIFFLALPDLAAFFHKTWDRQGMQALIADRKQQHQAWQAEIPPDVFTCDDKGYLKPLTAKDELSSFEMQPISTASRSGAVLQGIAASPGQATGSARILHHPDAGPRLQTGEILVAPSTNAAWTPLFLRASAVVMETGGYLSHGAIVAREFGIPAVVNVPDLLEKVKDGQHLTVDGDQGHILSATFGVDA